MYLVYLVNKERQLLHADPFILSVAGTAAVSIGEQLEAASKETFASLSKYGEEFKKLMQARMSLFSLRNFYLNFVTEGCTKGKGNRKAWVTSVKEIKAQFITDADTLTLVKSAAEINNGFFWKSSVQLPPAQVLEALAPAADNCALAGIDVKAEELPF
jgi:hypothetical protein